MKPAEESVFYVALGLVTAATLMLQIIETRIISVTSWYHLAFFVISIAMFGLTAGAVFVYLRAERFRPERLSYDLAVAALAFALTTDLAILVQLTLVTGASPSLTSLVAWAEFALCLAVPFFFSGVVVSLALTRSPYPIGKVYGADLIGAAAGCIGVLVLLNVTSGPSAVLWVGALIGLAALGFAGSGLGILARIRFARFQAISLPPKHRHRVPALCDCQHAHDLWRSTDDHQGSLGDAGRSCLRSLEFIFPHHRQSERNGPAGDVRRLAALAALDHRAASAEYRRRRRHCPVPLRWKPREFGVPAL